EADVDDVRRVLILRIGVDPRVVPGALAQIGGVARLRPRIAAVARTKHAALFRLDDRVDVLRIRRTNADADDAERPLRHALVARQLFPRVAAVGRLPQRRPFAAAVEKVRAAPEAPRRRVEDARIGWIHVQIDRAG